MYKILPFRFPCRTGGVELHSSNAATVMPDDAPPCGSTGIHINPVMVP